MNILDRLDALEAAIFEPEFKYSKKEHRLSNGSVDNSTDELSEIKEAIGIK